MTNNCRPLATVAIVGSGLVAHCAALAIKRSIPSSRLLLVRTPADPAALADRLPITSPVHGGFLSQLGLKEEELIRAGAVTHRLGQRFLHWGADERTWLQAYGRAVPLGWPGALHQHWLGAHRRGRAPTYASLSPAACLAEANRFCLPTGSGHPLLAHIDFGLMFEPKKMTAILAACCAQAGVLTIDGDVALLGRDEAGGCSFVLLKDGRSVAAEFFVDATGPAAHLANVVSPAFVSWAEWLPGDRFSLSSCDRGPAVSDSYRATDRGWEGLWPGREETLVGWCSHRGAKEPDIIPAAATPELIELAPGRRATPMAANVVALGDAAVACGPLGAAGFDVAVAQLKMLLELLPSRQPSRLLSEEYDRRASNCADAALDYLSSAYLVRPRQRGVFWRRLRDRSMPPGLSGKIARFVRRGTIDREDEDIHSAEDWHTRLIGLGIVPKVSDGVAGSAKSGMVDAALTRLGAENAALTARQPLYLEFLARLDEQFS